MTHFLLAILFLVIAITGVVVRKTYYSLPVKELKRQAEHGDELAATLYRAVAFGASLRALLWAIIALSSAVGIIILSSVSPFWLSLITVLALIWSAFSWLPASRVTRYGARVTILVTPALVWLLNIAYPLLSRSAEKIEHRYNGVKHTGIYERADVLELIEQQADQEDSRLSIEELAIIQRALTFGDYQVSDVLTPRATIKTISADDTVGPILIDELHKAESPYVLVLDKPKGEVVGTLTVQHLGLHSTGLVRDHMVDQIYYLHEADTLREALHAFFVTNCPLFIVVNSHEEYVGIVTMESIVRQLFGHLPGEDFEQYADRMAVAARHPRVPKAVKSPKKAPADDTEVLE
ncbi:MAG: exported protein of unknown function [Candidatus Saccharibacteria bacterium]|nr:exported protein of unknown function [Candidatus Saccharibacteria bacterium]